MSILNIFFSEPSVLHSPFLNLQPCRQEHIGSKGNNKFF